MGQAKARGTFEQRRAAAIARDEAAERAAAEKRAREHAAQRELEAKVAEARAAGFLPLNPARRSTGLRRGQLVALAALAIGAGGRP